MSRGDHPNFSIVKYDQTAGNECRQGQAQNQPGAVLRDQALLAALLVLESTAAIAWIVSADLHENSPWTTR